MGKKENVSGLPAGKYHIDDDNDDVDVMLGYLL